MYTWGNIILTNFNLLSKYLEGKGVGPTITRTLHRVQINFIVVYFKLQTK